MKKLALLILSSLFLCFMSCSDLDDSSTSKSITLNVLSPSASNRSVNASYWQESDCKKYGVSIYKTETGEVVDLGEFDKNGSISFTLSDEGDYTIEVIAYNSENIPIAGGSKDKTLSYGDTTDIIIYVIPYQKGFDITLNDGIEVVWVNPDTTGNSYTEIEAQTSTDYSIGQVIKDSNGSAIAVVAGQGADGVWFALGLKRSDSMLWLNQNESDSTYYKSIGTHVNQDGSYTGDADGSDNWAVVSATDSEKADKGLFLAFNWANSYGSNYANSISGWYLPSLVEYWIMWKNQIKIDATLEKLGGDKLQGYKYWSSSQDSQRTHYDAGDFSFYSSFNSDTSGWKTFEHNYCRAIFKLN